MSPLPPPVQAVLELFRGPLSEVRFADVDAAVLADSAHAVEAAAVAVAEQEAQLTELKQTLADKHEALLLVTQRALAYARVYAENDEALSEQLAGIALPRASKPRKASVKASNVDASTPTHVSDDTAAMATPRETLELDAQAAEVGDAETETEAAPSVSRKGKRRASAAREEAQDGPA